MSDKMTKLLVAMVGFAIFRIFVPANHPRYSLFCVFLCLQGKLQTISFSPSALIIVSYAWWQSWVLYLPLPLAVPAVNVFIPIFTSLITMVPNTPSRNRNRAAAALPIILKCVLTVSPIVLITISLAFCIPSSVLSCLLESQWDWLFRSKNAAAISSIQGQLRCCGFNSMHDRAWPFESHGVSVRECEETQGWSRRCLDVWNKWEKGMGGLVVATSIGNLIFTVSPFVSTYPAMAC